MSIGNRPEATEDVAGAVTGCTCSPRYGGIINFNKTTVSKIEA